MTKSALKKLPNIDKLGQKIKHRNTTYYPRRIVEEILAARGDRKAGQCFAAFRQGRLPTELITSADDLKPRLVQTFWFHCVTTPSAPHEIATVLGRSNTLASGTPPMHS